MKKIRYGCHIYSVGEQVELKKKMGKSGGSKVLGTVIKGEQVRVKKQNRDAKSHFRQCS